MVYMVTVVGVGLPSEALVAHVRAQDINLVVADNEVAGEQSWKHCLVCTAD